MSSFVFLDTTRMNILRSRVWVFDRKGAGSREKSLPHLGGPRGTRPAASGPWKSCNRIAGRFFNQTQHHHHVVRLGLRPSDEFDETRNVAAPQARLQECSPQLSLGKDFAADVSPLEVRERDVGQERRCCTALAESEIRLWWWPRYVSSMKYPKRCQYKHAKQKKYHVRNWAEYNEGLRRRGDLTVWFDEEAIANWKADKTGKPGGQRVYSDMAIETGLVVRMVYKLAYRQTEGFLHSIASLLGLGIEIPDYSTLCRRSRLLRKKLRIPKAASTQPIHLMIDSTGLRIHVGNARKPPKQRAWRKLHIAVDRETGNIVASELTASRARDATRVPALLTQIQAPLVSVAADSAYDKEAVYEAIEAHSPGRRTRVVIPPQRNATLSQNSNTCAFHLFIRAHRT